MEPRLPAPRASTTRTPHFTPPPRFRTRKPDKPARSARRSGFIVLPNTAHTDSTVAISGVTAASPLHIDMSTLRSRVPPHRPWRSSGADDVDDAAKRRIPSDVRAPFPLCSPVDGDDVLGSVLNSWPRGDAGSPFRLECTRSRKSMTVRRASRNHRRVENRRQTRDPAG